MNNFNLSEYKQINNENQQNSDIPNNITLNLVIPTYLIDNNIENEQKSIKLYEAYVKSCIQKSLFSLNLNLLVNSDYSSSIFYNDLKKYLTIFMFLGNFSLYSYIIKNQFGNIVRYSLLSGFNISFLAMISYFGNKSDRFLNNFLFSIGLENNDLSEYKRYVKRFKIDEKTRKSFLKL